MSEYQVNEALASAALARDLAKLRARAPRPLTVAELIAKADAKRGFFARLFGL